MSEPARFLILGNSQSAERFADGFADGGLPCVGAVSLRESLLPDNSNGLASWASKKAVNYFEITDANSVEFKTIVEKTGAELLLVQWTRILSQATISMFAAGAIGTHPSFIPWGRGRHPLHWQIVMGYSKIFLSIFQLTSEIDSGPLLLQPPIVVDSDETILTLVEKVNATTYQSGLELANQLLTNGCFTEISKVATRGSTWRKRTLEDIEIECRMSQDSISRLVRSIQPPYVGARLLTEFGSLTIEKVSSCHFAGWELHQIGSVLAVHKKSLVLRIDDGPVELFIYGSITERLHEVAFLKPPSFYKNRIIGKL